jgi:hypothetical protein
MNEFIAEAGETQGFYALLQGEAEDESYRLKNLCILRLADGYLSGPDQAFFATENTGTDVPVVDKAVYTSGAYLREHYRNADVEAIS